MATEDSISDKLSPNEEWIWRRRIIAPHLAAFNIAMVVSMKGQLDRRALELAMGDVVDRHDLLRATYSDASEVPARTIARSMPKPIVRDFGAQCNDTVESVLLAEAMQSFDLVRGPLIRCALAETGQNEFIFSLVLHHIIADGWSLGVICDDLSTSYAKRIGCADKVMRPIESHYSCYSEYMRDLLASDRFRRSLQFWNAQLADPLEPVPLDTDWPRASTISEASHVTRTALSRAASPRVRRCCAAIRVTPACVLLAAYVLLVSEMARGARDVVIGVNVANRPRSEYEHVVGYFANTIPLRFDVSDVSNPCTWLQYVWRVMVAGSAHQCVPFGVICRSMGTRMKRIATAMSRVTFQLLPRTAIEFPNVTTTRLHTVANGNASPDIDLRVRELGNSYELEVIYKVFAYSRRRIDAMLARYEEILDGLLEALSGD